MFRSVDLPVEVPGRLFLHSLPGRYEALVRVWHQLRHDGVQAIVCLTERDEMHQKSFEYAHALELGTAPCAVLAFAIPDRGAPADKDGFWQLAASVADRLRCGDTLLVHCAGGVGRTALLAITVLLALGQPVDEARSVVSRAGSTVETAAQSALIAWCAAKFSVAR